MAKEKVAQEPVRVRAQLSTGVAKLGANVQLVITAEGDGSASLESLDPVDGLRIAQPGSPMCSEFEPQVDGRSTRRVTLRWTLQIETLREGKFEFPVVRVTANGRTHEGRVVPSSLTVVDPIKGADMGFMENGIFVLAARLLSAQVHPLRGEDGGLPPMSMDSFSLGYIHGFLEAFAFTDRVDLESEKFTQGFVYVHEQVYGNRRAKQLIRESTGWRKSKMLKVLVMCEQLHVDIWNLLRKLLNLLGSFFHIDKGLLFLAGGDYGHYDAWRLVDDSGQVNEAKVLASAEVPDPAPYQKIGIRRYVNGLWSPWDLATQGAKCDECVALDKRLFFAISLILVNVLYTSFALPYSANEGLWLLLMLFICMILFSAGKKREDL